MGIVAGNNIDKTYAKIEPFRRALAEALGINVEIFVAKNYRFLIDAHVASRIEYAIYSATAYATAWKVCKCVEPLVLPRSTDGSDSFRTLIVSGPQGPENLTELARAKLAGLSKGSFAGHKFAAYELTAQGVKLPDEIEFAETGEAAVEQLITGDFQALIGWSTFLGDPGEGYSRGTLKLIADQNNGTILPYRVIWKSSSIPNRPHVIRKSLAGQAKSLLRNVLTQLYNSDPIAYDAVEPVFGGGFVAARHSQFLPVINYVSALAPQPKSNTITKEIIDQPVTK